MAKTVKTTQESSTGRNTKFVDKKSGLQMTRPQFVKKIEQGTYTDYHVRKINGIKTPVSNPDNKSRNNLG